MSLDIGELVGHIRLDPDGVATGIAKAESEIRSGASRIEQAAAQTGAKAGKATGDRFSSALAPAFKAVSTGATLAAGGTLGLVVSATKAGVAYNTLQQSSRAALSTILGGSKAANKQMDALDKFAKESPFAKQVFIRAQQQLLGFGVAADKVVPTLDAIQNAVAAVGGSNDDIASITFALAQMQGQGKLTGETLNQLGQYGIDAATLLGDQMGKTGQEIRDMASNPGGIPVDQVWDPLVTALQTRFDGAAANVKNTWVGATDRIKGAWRDVGSALAEPLVGHEAGGMAIGWANAFADLLRGIQAQVPPMVQAVEGQLQPALDDIEPTLERIANKLKAIDPATISALVAEAVKIAPAIAGASAAVGAFGTNQIPILSKLGLSLNPVVAGIAAVVATSPELRSEAVDLLKALSPLIPVVGDLAGLLAALLTPATAGVAHAIHPLVGLVGATVDAFDALPGPVKTAAAALGVFLLLKPKLDAFGTDTSARFRSGWGQAAGSLDTLRLSAMYAGDAFRNAGGGFKGFNAGLRSVSTNMGGLKAVGGGLMGALGGPWGLAITGATAAVAYWAKKSADAKAEIQALTDAIEADSGVVGENTRAHMVNTLQREGVLDAARDVGLNLERVTDAALGEGDAIAYVNGHMKSYADSTDAARAAGSTANVELDKSDKAFQKVDEAINGANERIRTAKREAKNHADAMGEDAKQTKGAADATKSLGDQTKETGDKSRDAADGGKAFAQAVADQKQQAEDTAKQVKELAKAMEEYLKQTYSTRDSERAYQQAIDDANQALKDNKANLDIGTEAGRKNQAALDNIAKSALDVAEANFKQGGSLKSVTKQVMAAREEFIGMATRMGMSRLAAEQLADKLGLTTDNVDVLHRAVNRLPKFKHIDITAATETALTGVREIDQALVALKDRHVTVTVEQQGSFNKMAGMAGQFAGHAGGGTVGGYGGPVADDQLIRASSGEEVIRNGPAQRFRPWLKAINADRFTPQMAASLAASVGAQAATGRTVDARTTIHHHGDVVAADPNAYLREMEAKARRQRLGDL